MDENEITLSMLQIKEISAIIEKLNKLARLNMTEGELRKALLDANLRIYKIVRDYGVIGILKYDKNNPSEMNVWMNDDQAETVIIQSIRLTIDHIFRDDLKTKIKWPIIDQMVNRELINAAKFCGFEEEGRVLGESSNGNAILKLALLRKSLEKRPQDVLTGDNIPKINIDGAKKMQRTIQELNSDLTKMAKDLETEKMLNKKLQTALDNAEENNRTLENRILSFQKDAEKEKPSDGDERSRITDELKQKNTELEALLIQLRNENVKLTESINSKERQIINQIARIKELQNEPGQNDTEETAIKIMEPEKETVQIIPAGKTVQSSPETYQPIIYIGSKEPFWKTIKPATPLRQKIAVAALPIAMALIKMKKDISISELSSKAKIRKENTGELIDLIEKKLWGSRDFSINILNADNFETCRIQRK